MKNNFLGEKIPFENFFGRLGLTTFRLLDSKYAENANKVILHSPGFFAANMSESSKKNFDQCEGLCARYRQKSEKAELFKRAINSLHNNDVVERRDGHFSCLYRKSTMEDSRIFCLYSNDIADGELISVDSDHFCLRSTPSKEIFHDFSGASGVTLLFFSDVNEIFRSLFSLVKKQSECQGEATKVTYYDFDQRGEWFCPSFLDNIDMPYELSFKRKAYSYQKEVRLIFYNCHKDFPKSVTFSDKLISQRINDAKEGVYFNVTFPLFSEGQASCETDVAEIEKEIRSSLKKAKEGGRCDENAKNIVY